MKKSEELRFLMENGALVVQAHLYRQASYIDHIRLFPDCVHGVEIMNACRTELENEMAAHYAKSYALLTLAGTDSHKISKLKKLAGIMTHTPIESESDFCRRVFDGETEIFTLENPFYSEQV